MSSDEAVFQSNLEDLESFAALLSPISAQSWEAMVVDSALYIDFDKSQGIIFSGIRLHPKNSLSNMQDTMNQLKSFFVD